MANEFEKQAAQFVAVLLHSATNAHFMHLQTRSYAVHKALNEYYDGIVDLTDQYAEAYQGAYDVIKAYPSDFAVATDPTVYLTRIKTYVEAAREKLPEDTALQNIVDEIVDLISSTLYKLRFLK